MNKKFIDFMKDSRNVYILQHGDEFISYLNTSNFIISNNYYGLLAYGERSYNYAKKTVFITYKIINHYVITNSTCEFLIKKFEKKINTKNVVIKEAKRKYYIDKQFQDPAFKDTYCSYEAGPLHEKYFDDEEEARQYADNNSYLLEKNEIFCICSVEE